MRVTLPVNPEYQQLDKLKYRPQYYFPSITRSLARGTSLARSLAR